MNSINDTCRVPNNKDSNKIPTGNQNMTDKEIVLTTISNCAEEMQKDCERKVPENGKYNTVVGIEYNMKNGKTFAFDVVHDEKEPQNQRRIKLSVRHSDSDISYENYIFKGTKKEVINYFANIDVNEIYNEIMHLSSKVDEFYSK